MTSKKSKVYICSWDCNGFESITDMTSWEKNCLVDMIAGKELKDPPVSLHALTLRARFNPQRNPEIWSFNTTQDIDTDMLWELAEKNPQSLVDMIRKNGKCLYRLPTSDPVIK